MLMLASPQTPPPRADGVIEGTVTRFGTSDPLQNVEIAIGGTRFNRRALADAVTDAKGHFEIRDVLPGKYVLLARRSGYVNPAVNGVRLRDGGAERAVTVGPGQRVENADLTLVPGAVVAGRVLDPDGKPLVRMRVDARFAAPSSQNLDGVPYWLGAGTETNDRGEYRIPGLEAGKYLIAAENPNNTADVAGDFAKTYFPRTVDDSRATVVTLGIGEVRESLDITMQPPSSRKTFKISGKVVSPTGAYTQFSGASEIYLIPTDSPALHSIRETLINNESDVEGDANHVNFEFHAFPGNYDIYVDVNPDVRKGYSHSEVGVAGKATITVRDEDIEDITITAGGVEVRGQVVVREETGTKPTGFAYLRLASEDVATQSGKPGDDGSFTIPAVINGVWKGQWRSPQNDLVVIDVRQGAESVFENGFAVSDQTPEPIQIILMPVGAIDGIVRDGQQQPVAGAEILLLPASPNEGNSALIQRTSTDAAGRFTIPIAAMGGYSLYALSVSDFPPGSIPESPAALRTFLAPYADQGKPATVTAGVSVSVTLTSLRK